LVIDVWFLFLNNSFNSPILPVFNKLWVCCAAFYIVISPLHKNSHLLYKVVVSPSIPGDFFVNILLYASWSFLIVIGAFKAFFDLLLSFNCIFNNSWFCLFFVFSLMSVSWTVLSKYWFSHCCLVGREAFCVAFFLFFLVLKA